MQDAGKVYCAMCKMDEDKAELDHTMHKFFNKGQKAKGQLNAQTLGYLL
jgi:hypothetical protein